MSSFLASFTLSYPSETYVVGLLGPKGSLLFGASHRVLVDQKLQRALAVEDSRAGATLEGARESVDLRPAPLDYYARHLADGTFLSWLALDRGRVVATSGISIVEKPPYFACPTGRIGLVSSMYTTPGYRRQGIARDLLCRVLDEAGARGCGAAQVTASDAGVPLYRSLGFTHNPNFMQLVL